MQSIPLAVLKPVIGMIYPLDLIVLHAIHTACGIETHHYLSWRLLRESLHAIHTACGIETRHLVLVIKNHNYCMQSIPLAVLKLKTYSELEGTSDRLHAIHTACGIETELEQRE